MFFFSLFTFCKKRPSLARQNETSLKRDTSWSDVGALRIMQRAKSFFFLYKLSPTFCAWPRSASGGPTSLGCQTANGSEAMQKSQHFMYMSKFVTTKDVFFPFSDRVWTRCRQAISFTPPLLFMNIWWPGSYFRWVFFSPISHTPLSLSPFGLYDSLAWHAMEENF